MSPVCTLGGVPLEAHETVGWRLTQGVAPYQRVFEVHRDRADAILRAAPTPESPVELFIGGRKPTLIKGVYILSLQPAKHPKRVSILCTDGRYWADRILVRREFNIRRKSGERRLVDGNMQRINPQDDVTFARYSLRGEKSAWLAKEAVEDVLKEVSKGKYSFGKVDFSKLGQVDIDGLILKDDGQTALKKVLDFVPSLTCYMSKNAIWTLTLINGAEEEEQFGSAPPPIVGPDLPMKIDMSRPRPRAIELYFQPEDELRVDFLEGITQTTTTREPRIFRNVIQLPDRKLTYVSGPLTGKVVVKGTWVEIDEHLFNAWNADAANPRTVTINGRTINLPPISFEVLRKLWFSPGGYHAYYEIAGGNSVWAKRWRALMAHYRQTFQVDRRWRDRIRFARAERVAIQDPENARWAPSDVIADHAVLPSAKRIAETRNDAKLKLATNQYAWPLSDSRRLLVDGKICETALLTPVDEDQMVFHVIYQLDQDGNSQGMCPFILSLKTEGGPVDIPEADPRAPQAAFMLGLAQPSPKHRFTTVLTVAPASPQGLAGLHKVVVTPDEAKKFLPSSVAKNIGDCKGPVYQLFVEPGVFPAASAWRDEDSAEIENAILNGGPRTDARLIYPQHVKNIAGSMAAIIYALFADRTQGQHVADMDGDAEPVGRISSVVHELGRRGITLTRRDMPPSMKALNWKALLPDETRRILGKVKV